MWRTRDSHRADVAAKIFEPFFTVKPKGTGLGLAIARKIAQAHGGDLVLSVNEPGRVRFTFWVPQDSAAYVEGQGRG